MTDINTIENRTPTNLTKASINIITDCMKEASDSLYNTSKAKYEHKVKLIEKAEDMTTKEKLEALDQNYDRHNQEVWQGIFIFGVASLTVIVIVTKDLAIIKNIRRLVA